MEGPRPCWNRPQRSTGETAVRRRFERVGSLVPCGCGGRTLALGIWSMEARSWSVELQGVMRPRGRRYVWLKKDSRMG
jgi:hypothetical protein